MFCRIFVILWNKQANFDADIDFLDYFAKTNK